MTLAGSAAATTTGPVRIRGATCATCFEAAIMAVRSTEAAAVKCCGETDDLRRVSMVE